MNSSEQATAIKPGGFVPSASAAAERILFAREAELAPGRYELQAVVHDAQLVERAAGHDHRATHTAVALLSFPKSNPI